MKNQRSAEEDHPCGSKFLDKTDILFDYRLFLFNILLLSVPDGSLMSRYITHTTRARATTDIPRKVSLSISEADGVKNSAPASRYSTTASTSHIRDAPQNIYSRTPVFSSLALELVYHITVEITAAITVISSVMTMHLPFRYRVWR